jgi:sugar phosphate isomerase/epimerase
MTTRQFGFSEYCTPMWSLEEDLQHFRAAGATCFELSEAKMEHQRMEEQLALIRESGLHVSTVQPAVESFFDVKLSATKVTLEANRESLHNSVEFLGKSRIADRFNTISGVLPDYSWAEALPYFAKEYRELCRRAADYEIKVMIEPLHPIYCGLDSMISTFSEAAQLVDAVGADNLGFTFDVWHVWQQATVYEDIFKHADRIWAVHISDWKPIRCAVDRHIPGDGQIPLGKLMRTLEAAGYDNGYLVEFFSDRLLPDSLWRQDMDHVLRLCKMGFDKAWEASV